MDDIWAELERAERAAARPNLGVPSDLELEAPPTLHPVPLVHARDATAGETVTARMLGGELRDWTLTDAVMPPGDPERIAEELCRVENRGLASRAQWLQGQRFQDYPMIVNPWPVDQIWVWRAAPSPTPPERIPASFDWALRAGAPRHEPSPRVPMRVQDVGPLTGRTVTIRDLDGVGPGPWVDAVAVGEIEDGPDGYVVPFRDLDVYAEMEMTGLVSGGVSRFPVHRVWVRV